MSLSTLYFLKLLISSLDSSLIFRNRCTNFSLFELRFFKKPWSINVYCWYFDVTVGTSSLRNHLQNGALNDLDVMILGLAMSKLKGQYNDRCLGGPL